MVDKEIVVSINFEDIKFPVFKTNHHKIERISNVRVTIFGYKDKQLYPIPWCKEKFEIHMEFFLIGMNTILIMFKSKTL